jgi:hypothetical protein
MVISLTYNYTQYQLTNINICLGKKTNINTLCLKKN